MRARQPVITGLGIVSPIGTGVERFWAAACAGKSGSGAPTSFDASKLARECQVVAEVKDFEPKMWLSGQSVKMTARFSQFAVAAARMACSDSGLETSGIPARRVRVALGTSTNGLAHVIEPTIGSFLRGEDIWPWAVLELPAHAATSHVAIATGSQGESMTFATACAAGLDAIGWAAEAVRRGEASAVIAGGTESPLSPYCLTALHAVGVLSKWDGPPEEASRPFDALRSGLVIAEGAAAVVIEEAADARARGAPIYAYVEGFASAIEATHLRKVDEHGQSVTVALTEAIDRAGLDVRDIDYIAAHGNSMVDYDIAEITGIKRALGRHAWNVPVSSVKSMCGQALAASGAIQVVVTCLSMRDGIITPTINYTVPDPACDLDCVPNVARRARVRATLIHAHSLGGSHSALALTSSPSRSR